MRILSTSLTAALTIALAHTAHAQIQGPSTGSTPYVLPVLPGLETISVLTVDNTGPAADDNVNKIGGGSYSLMGIPDGMGAFDNGDGSFTLLVNHELGNTQGVVRDHGAIGAFVSKWIVYKNSLLVYGGEDLMKQIYGWNSSTQQSNPTPTPFAFNRYCSADLAPVTAYYNPASGLGTQTRIFLNGEEGGATGWARGHVATGADAGKSYVLGKFNLSTNGSGLPGVGGWENILANPFPQDKTVVIGTNDGGTEIMTNSVAVYVGTKTSSGSEVDRAGLTNGTLKFVVVTGNPVEITSSANRTTNITSGTPFTLSGTASTMFSRPEDGAWNPLNPKQFYFVTTDQLDQVSDGLGTQIGRTRLWRLNFTDITNPDLGGTIDLLIDGQTVDGQKVNMFDNITVNAITGRLLLQEDVGSNTPHNGKVWEYDPATFTGTTNSGVLTMIAKHDPARFGDRVAGVSTPATAPFTNDEETSGIIDITAIMSGSALHKGNFGEAWYITSDQAHYTTGISTAQVEGGQIVVIHELGAVVTRGGFVRDRRTGTFAQQLTVTNGTGAPITGPVGVWIDNLPSTVRLANPSGPETFIVVPGTESGLAPGATATLTLQFTNPTNGAITYTTRVQPGASIQ